MNTKIKEFYDMNRMYIEPRDKLMEILTDQDLGYKPTEANPTLGELCRELGETAHAYAQSFKTFKVDFSYRSDDAELKVSVKKLKQWYQELDMELKDALEAISDADVENRKVDRGDFELPPHIHLDVYREALLIFYGKVSVYLTAMHKPFPELWQHWIG